MRYPEFLKENEAIGVCAPSAGLGKYEEHLNRTLSDLKQSNIKTILTESVRVNNKRSASAKKRVDEFNELLQNKDVKTIVFATGGDYAIEVLPYLDFELINKYPKWMIGMSDPTNLLFPITTKLDIATMYGTNFHYFTESLENDHDIALDYLKGNIKTQKTFKKTLSFLDLCNEEMDKTFPVKWISKNDFETSGRCIGGCMEVLQLHLGTKYDYTLDFINRYKEDGIIWYFDVFSYSSYQFYLALTQFKNAGWFNHCKAVIVGRVAFASIEDPKMNYVQAADKVLGKIPHIMDADVGHTRPGMTMINGALLNLTFKNNKGKLQFKLK